MIHQLLPTNLKILDPYFRGGSEAKFWRTVGRQYRNDPSFKFKTMGRPKSHEIIVTKPPYSQLITFLRTVFHWDVPFIAIVPADIHSRTKFRKTIERALSQIRCIPYLVNQIHVSRYGPPLIISYINWIHQGCRPFLSRI